MAPENAADMTDAEAAAYLRDPSTSAGFLPQWIRDDLADKLDEAQRGSDMLRGLLAKETSQEKRRLRPQSEREAGR